MCVCLWFPSVCCLQSKETSNWCYNAPLQSKLHRCQVIASEFLGFKATLPASEYLVILSIRSPGKNNYCDGFGLFLVRIVYLCSLINVLKNEVEPVYVLKKKILGSQQLSIMWDSAAETEGCHHVWSGRWAARLARGVKALTDLLIDVSRVCPSKQPGVPRSPTSLTTGKSLHPTPFNHRGLLFLLTLNSQHSVI